MSQADRRRIGNRILVATAVIAVVSTISVTGVSTHSGRAGAVTLHASVRVCNQSSLSGSLPFVVNNGTHFQVTSGACRTVVVPEGDNIVKELVDPTGATELESIGVTPPSANVAHFVVNSSSVAGHAKVDVPAGTTVTVTFTNGPALPRVNVCTALTTYSQALSGNTFDFTVNDVAGTQSVSVVGNAPGQTPACTRDPTALPAGSVAYVTEIAQPNIALTNVSVSPASADAGSTPTTAAVTVQASQVASATFTNEALGWVEVCENAADPSTGTQIFPFSIASEYGNGQYSFDVAAGQCSQPYRLPAGPATIIYPAFPLAWVTTSGCGSETQGPVPAPVTVQVCYGKPTIVSITEAAVQGQFKICTQQTSSDANLDNGEPFVFDYSYTVDGTITTGSVTLTNPETGTTCSAVSGLVPVMNANGSTVNISVSEQEPSTPSVELADVRYQGNGTVVNSPSLPTTIFPTALTFSNGAGMNIVTFTQGSAG